MRHVKYLDMRRMIYDGEVECLYVVIGQRDEAREKPKQPGPKSPAEEMIAWRKFLRESSNGRYALTTLAWCETIVQADAAKDRFAAPEWINVRVEPVSQILRHSQPGSPG